MSPAKRTSPAKKPSSRAAKTAADLEIALPSESDHLQAESADSTDSSDDMKRRIRERAYEIFRSRNAGDGDAEQDWLAAEREVRSNRHPSDGHASMLLDSSSGEGQRDVAR